MRTPRTNPRLPVTSRTGAIGAVGAFDRLLEGLFGRTSSPIEFHRFGHDDEAFENADVNDDVLEAYRQQAIELHDRFVHDHGVFVVEFLGSTGSGKTSLIERLIDRQADPGSVGVIVGDVAGDDDARRLREHGAVVATVNTGRECHLDQSFIEEGLDQLDPDPLDALFVENVGNMVCPADVPLGAQARILVVSTTEGDDVVRKHPLLFQASDAAVINKVDVADALDADVDRMLADVEEVTAGMPTFPTSVKRGDGLDAVFEYLDEVRARGHAPADDDDRDPVRPSELNPHSIRLESDY